MAKTIAPYGTWRSPITAAALAAAGISLNELQAQNGNAYWVELRPAEKGRSVLVQRTADGTISDITPKGYSVRSRVHEYGGGASHVAGDVVYFVNDEDQRLYRQPIGGTPEPLTSNPESLRALRYADIRLHPNGRFLVCVREQHYGSDVVINELISIDFEDNNAIRVVATGYDFYANARFSPNGTQLAYVSWNHPNMPWDDTELWVAPFNEDGTLGKGRKVAGEAGESVMQPEWDSDGTLYFISDRSNWWNLYREKGGVVEPVAPMEAEVGIPAWNFDVNRYNFLTDGSIVAFRTANSLDDLFRIQTDGTVAIIPTEGYSVFRGIAYDSGTVYVIAAGATHGQEALAIELGTNAITVLKESSTFKIDDALVSKPQVITYPTTNDVTAHAYYYPPTNPYFEAPADELPPLLVNVHGGPTSQTKGALVPGIQYWTSRGFGYVDVNYGGGTGYGREFRERLREAWGFVDVDDSINAARYLIDQSQADPHRVAVRGGSAGGYTTLRALTFSDFFTAGASYFGVADLETMARDTHKFESRYLDSLIGPYPAEKERYYDRSPVHFADKISAPLLVLQGEEDMVVPLNQAEDMVAAMQQTGTPYAYIVFEGEGHGFRRADSLIKATESELDFYGQVFGFNPADEIEPVEMVNFSKA